MPIDLSEFQSRNDVRAALADVKRVAPPLSSLRDGIVIDGIICRLTIGSLTLLQIANNEIFFSDDVDTDKPLDDKSIFECIWLCCEDNIDEAVFIADKPEILNVVVSKFMKSYSKRMRLKMCKSVFAWVHSQVRVIEQMNEEESASSSLPTKWRVESVDILASNYGWSEDFIMWKLPLVRAMEYQECIIARISGEQISDDISDDTIRVLELLEKEKANG